MSDPIICGYWGFRGKGQMVRHLLAYSGLNFQEKNYTQYALYIQQKFNLGLDFPNLPYLLDGDIKITQTLGIARHIVRRCGKLELMGKTPQDEARMENYILSGWDEIFQPLLYMFFNKKVLDIKTAHYYKNKAKYEKFQKSLANRQYTIGYLTIADFYISQGSFYLEKLFPDEYKKYKNIHKIREKVQNLPEIKAYYERENHVRTPFLNPNSTGIPFYYPGTQPILDKKSSKNQEKPKQAPKQVVQKTEKIQELKAEQFHKQEQKVQEQKYQEIPVKSQPVASQPVPSQPVEEQQAIPEIVDFYANQKPLKVVLISGSLGGNSPVNYFLNSLYNFGHPSFSFEWADISSLEMHNQDIEEEGTENANNLRGQLYEADSVLIGVSETNNGISSVLTNAYNWMIAVIRQKPIGLVAIENNQQKFRTVLDEGGLKYMKKPEFSVKGESFFNEEGNIAESKINVTTHFLNSYAKFIEESN